MKICAYFVSCVLLSAVVCGCAERDELTETRKAKSPIAQDELAEAPQEMLSSFSVGGYGQDGSKQWDLEGNSADIMDEVIKMRDVTGKVYGQNANMTIVADQGSLKRLDNNVHLERNVVATSDDGATLTTDYLDWDAENQSLVSEAPVYLQRGAMKARGTGMMAQPELGLVELKRDVTVEVSFAKGSASQQKLASTIITCDGALNVDYEKNVAIFHDNVKVTDERGEIFADTMDVYFATQSKQGKQLAGMEGMGIEKVIAEGAVEIHRGNNTSFSQKALYTQATGTLTLTGQPKLVIYSTEDLTQLAGSLTGEEQEE